MGLLPIHLRPLKGEDFIDKLTLIIVLNFVDVLQDETVYVGFIHRSLAV
jgi:hypothetical protein